MISLKSSCLGRGNPQGLIPSRSVPAGCHACAAGVWRNQVVLGRRYEAQTAVCRRLRQRALASRDSGDGGDSPLHGDASGSGVQPGAFTYRAIATNLGQLDSNQLQTALSTAIIAEDFELAAAVRDEIAARNAAVVAAENVTDGGDGGGSQLLDWRRLGLPDWLAERAEGLGLRFPTEVQRRAAPPLLAGCDATIASVTGSGKTAAFLLPALARLGYPPDVFADDLVGPQLLLLVPTFELGTQAAILLYKLFGGNINSRQPGDPANMFGYTGPRGLKVRGLLNEEELAMAAADPRYLAGVTALVATPDAALGALRLQPPPLVLRDLRVVVADEVDALLSQYPSSFREVMDEVSAPRPPPLPRQQLQQQEAEGAGTGPAGGAGGGGAEAQQQAVSSSDAAETGRGGIGAVFGGGPGVPGASSADNEGPVGGSSSSAVSSSSSREAGEALEPSTSSGSGGGASAAKPQVVLVGATVSDGEVELAMQHGWVAEPVVLRVGQPLAVPSGLMHSALVVPKERQLAALVAALRRDLDATSADAAPTRVMLFFASEGEATAAAEPLRTALWSQHQLSVLLPTGAEPIKALHAFRDRAASLLLCTPSASRGLDLPAVSHVYLLGPPPDAREYLHRAGRAGRIGSTTGGIVTSIVTQEQLPRLQQVVEGELGLQLQVTSGTADMLRLLPSDFGSGVLGDTAAAAAGSGAEGSDRAEGGALESARKGLEDLFNLY